jgi:hypothetical protein
MTKEVIAALIGAGGAIIAALIALLKREGKKKASTPSQPAGPIVQGSQGVVIATQGGTVIQHTSPAQFEEINKNLNHIQEVLRTHLPAVPASQLDNVKEVDAMIHPNKWRALPVTMVVFPEAPANDREFLQSFAGKLLVRYLAYAAFRAGDGKYRRSIINVNFPESSEENEFSVHFVTNDGALLRELKQLFDRKQTEQTLNEIAIALYNWDFAKKFAFVRNVSLETTLEPDQKLVSFRNAPIYEGEDTDSQAILAQKVLIIDEVAAQSIQGSISKVLAFLGRVQLGQAVHENLVVQYDLDGQSLYKPHFLRLLYQILDRKQVAFDLFRISIDDPEKWDYMYHHA